MTHFDYAYTVSEVAEKLGRSRQTVLRYLADGRLSGEKSKIGRQVIWLISPLAVDQLIAHMKPAGRPRGEAAQ
jgi:excisionase family DNA binding protein